MATLEISNCDQCPHCKWTNPYGLDDQVTRNCNHEEQIHPSVTIKIRNAEDEIVKPCPLERG